MSLVNKSIEEAIAMKAEYIRYLAEHTENTIDEAELWGQYTAFCWIENLLDIDWSKYNSKAVKFTNKIFERGQKSKKEDE